MRRVSISVVCVCLFMAATPGSIRDARAQGAKASVAQRKEMDRKAQIAFVAGRYQEAIDLFAQLFADFGDAEYLRNVGRCYQRMRQPDQAIASFDEYLAKAKSLTPAERDEVKGFIKEMEDLKKRRAAEGNTFGPPPTPPAPAPAPTPAAPTPTPPASTPPPAAAPPTPGPTYVPIAASPPAADPGTAYGGGPGTGAFGPPPPPPPPHDLSATAPPPATPEATSGTGRVIGIVLMGAGVAALAGGGIMTALSWSESNSAKDKYGCSVYSQACNDAADTVESRNLIAKLLFGGGAVLAASGAVVFFLSPSPSAPSASMPAGFALGAVGRF